MCYQWDVFRCFMPMQKKPPMRRTAPPSFSLSQSSLLSTMPTPMSSKSSETKSLKKSWQPFARRPPPPKSHLSSSTSQSSHHPNSHQFQLWLSLQSQSVMLVSIQCHSSAPGHICSNSTPWSIWNLFLLSSHYCYFWCSCLFMTVQCSKSSFPFR